MASTGGHAIRPQQRLRGWSSVSSSCRATARGRTRDLEPLGHKTWPSRPLLQTAAATASMARAGEAANARVWWLGAIYSRSCAGVKMRTGRQFIDLVCRPCLSDLLIDGRRAGWAGFAVLCFVEKAHYCCPDIAMRLVILARRDCNIDWFYDLPS